MAASKKNRAHRLITLGERAILDGATGPVMNDPRWARLATGGVSARVDAEIRKRSEVTGPWADITPEAFRSLPADHPGWLVLFCCHPNGFVRQVAVELACRWTHSPGAAQIVALRSVDPAPPIRQAAQRATAELFDQVEPERQGGGSPPPTNVVVAGRQVVGTTKCLDFCPQLVELALQFVSPTTSNGFPSRSDKEVHRRTQVLRELEARSRAEDSSRDETTIRLIDWYRESLRSPTD